MADPVLIPEPDPKPATTTGASRSGEPTAIAAKQATPSRPASVPNSRKGYKLTLWVSATSEDGVADAHGLLQLDGADPVPFCQVRGVQNPLARALQEAFLAIQRVRAKPPRMNAPSTGAASPTRSHAAPVRPTQASAPTTPASPPRTPAPASMPAESAATKKRKPVGQPSLF